MFNMRACVRASVCVFRSYFIATMILLRVHTYVRCMYTHTHAQTHAHTHMFNICVLCACPFVCVPIYHYHIFLLLVLFKVIASSVLQYVFSVEVNGKY